jgi:hypothetical protein
VLINIFQATRTVTTGPEANSSAGEAALADVRAASPAFALTTRARS